MITGYKMTPDDRDIQLTGIYSALPTKTGRQRPKGIGLKLHQ